MDRIEREIEKKRRELEKLERQQNLHQQLDELESKIQRKKIDMEAKKEEFERKGKEPLELAISFPTGRTEWKGGQTVVIKWCSTGLVGNWVRVDLLKGGRLYHEIMRAASIQEGSLPWKVPDSLPSDDDYSIRLIGHFTGLSTTSDKFKIS